MKKWMKVESVVRKMTIERESDNIIFIRNLKETDFLVTILTNT